jgi:hypothetical protein
MPLQPWRLPELEVGAASSGVASLDVTRRGRNRRGLGLVGGRSRNCGRQLVATQIASSAALTRSAWQYEVLVQGQLVTPTL